MPLEVGRVCMKIAGREAGKYCVVVKKLDNSFVLVAGPKELTGVKRRKCNIQHLEALPYTLEIKEDASDKEITEAFKKANLVKKLGLKLPSEAKLKEEKKEEKPEKKTKEKRKTKGS